MKTPSPACFATWREHDVLSHVEWIKQSPNRDMAVIVHLFGASWGYLVVKSENARWTIVKGEFDFEWMAMDACAKAEAAWVEATGATP